MGGTRRDLGRFPSVLKVARPRENHESPVHCAKRHQHVDSPPVTSPAKTNSTSPLNHGHFHRNDSHNGQLALFTALAIRIRSNRIMQTVWPRVGLAQSSCRCQISVYSTNALIRRSTTAAPRRKVSVADVFTACYTTILGTAAILDARRKDQRRRVLDGELDRAKASLQALGAPKSRSFLDVDEAEEWNEFVELPGGNIPSFRPIPSYFNHWRGYRSVQPFIRELKDLYKITYRPYQNRSWLQQQIDWANIETAVASEELTFDIFLDDPQNHAQLVRVANAVIRLVRSLMTQAAAESNQPQDKLPDLGNDALDEVFRGVENTLQGQYLPSYQLPVTDTSHSARIRIALSQSLRRIFNQALSSTETVGRICYNLLHATVPPTIHTYNVLIAGFNRIQRPDLAEIVVGSFMRHTRWGATDQTVICILNHYQRPGGQQGLREVIQSIRGGRIHRLKLSTIEEDHFDDQLPEGVYRVSGLRRNDALYDWLIRGWLYHNKVGIACMTFLAFLRHGVNMPLHTVETLFHACLLKADFADSRKLLIGIIRRPTDFWAFISRVVDDNPVAAVRRLMRKIYQVINISWYPFGEVYGQSWVAYKEGTITFKLQLSRWIMQLEVREATSLLSELSDALNSGDSILSRLDKAIAALDAAKSGRSNSARFEILYDRLAMLVSIERRCLDLARKSRILDLGVRVAIIHAETKYNMAEREMMVSDSITSPSMAARRNALHSALRQVDIFDTAMEMSRIKAQLFWAIPNPDLVWQLARNHNWKRLGVQTLLFFYRRGVASPPLPNTSSVILPEILLPPLRQEYQDLEQQIRESEYSIRALFFVYMSSRKQRAALWYYGSYYDIPLHKVAEYAGRELYCTEVPELAFRKYDPKLPRHVPRDTGDWKREVPRLWPLPRVEGSSLQHAVLG
ncbi:hypothetical protein GGR50DRAFT_676891 [Xylaria sp. CBS 124048]|nr:hypothetical protein GGR50DRAFT_676891 [Xylaria sp. CBS 124048]